MVFTRDQIEEIRKKLFEMGVTDLSMPEADTPLSGTEVISLVQNGVNKKINISDFWRRYASYFENERWEAYREAEQAREADYESLKVMINDGERSRYQAEQERSANETARLDAEEDRYQAEIIRQQEFNTMKNQLEELIEEGGIGEINVQADWNEKNDTKDSYIKNKPDVYTSSQTDSAIQNAVANKADKVSSAVSGDIATLDANGNLTDSGKKVSYFAPQSSTYTKQEVDAAIEAIDVSSQISGKQDVISDLDTIRSGAAAGATAVQPAAMNTALAGKQNTLTFDSTPTASSGNPVTSGGVKNALDAKADKSDTYTKAEIGNLITPIDSEVIVGALPASGVANKVYRVPGTDSYTDYGWDGTQFVQLATYDGDLTAAVGYYVCPTAAATAAKIVTASGYILTRGGCIRIKFNFANTAASPTLNVNGTGAKPIYINGEAASPFNTWKRGEVVQLYYDGEYWQCNLSEEGRTVYVSYVYGYTYNPSNVLEINPTGGYEDQLIPVDDNSSLYWVIGDRLLSYTIALQLFDINGTYLGKWDSGGYNLQRSITVTANKGYRFIRASFNRLYNGLPNVTPIIVDGIKYQLIDTSESGWREICIGSVVNCDNSGGVLVHSETYDPVRVSQHDAIVIPIDAAKIRVICPHEIYWRVWFGNSAATGFISSSQSYGGKFYGAMQEFDIPSGYKSMRFVFKSGADSPGNNLPAESIKELINDRKLRIEYYVNDESTLDRLKSCMPHVAALNRKLLISDLANSNMGSLPVFAHISDLHGDSRRLANAFELCDNIKVSALLNSGDATLNQHRDGTTYQDVLATKYETPLLFCIGNHESFPTGQQSIYSDNIQVLAQSEGYMEDEEVITTHCYWFKDFPLDKIRVIALNYYEDGIYTGKIGQEQITWFVKTLKSVPDGYGILVMLHSPEDYVPINGQYDTFMQREKYRPDFPGFYVGNRPILQIIDSYIEKSVVNITFTDNGDTVSVDDDFSEVSGEFIAYICGHRHEDSVGYYEHSAHKQLCLCVTTGNAMYGDSSNPAWSNQSDLPRGGIGYTQDAFNLYGIDRDAGVVKIVRIGSDITQTFNERKAMVIPYK